MAENNLVLEINRRELGTPRLVEESLPALAPGQVRLRIERFALTANTVTYAVTGDVLGYWDFFPGPDPAWGRVPAMGWAQVVASNHAGVEPGARLFGWYPMARYVDMAVTPVADGLRDDGAHRASHAPVYRACVDTRKDPFHRPGTEAEDRHALLRGLFITGWLAEDFFADNGWFGAARVLVLSASSKTAIAFAQCADEREGIEVIGVTSSRNHAFTYGIGCYDEVVTYDDIPAVPAAAPIVAIDMSGSGPVLAAVHSHLDGQLKYSMAVGRSHHEAPSRDDRLAGPKPAFFFAPGQVKKRLQDWGPQGYQQRLATALERFVERSRAWLSVEHVAGGTAAVAAWREAHAGRVSPAVGHVVTLWD